MIVTSGKRKTAVAHVRLSSGKGDMIINGKDSSKYFPTKVLDANAKKPFALTETTGKFNTIIEVRGGGVSAQSDAIRHGIAQALVIQNKEFKSVLKEHKLLTRDSRQVERKKPGLKKARRAPQFSKR